MSKKILILNLNLMFLNKRVSKFSSKKNHQKNMKSLHKIQFRDYINQIKNQKNL